MVPYPLVAFRLLCEAVLTAQDRIKSDMAKEIAGRRPFWIGGVPTELDLDAARKAVARRLKTTPEIVAAMLATPSPEPKE
jgi:hypothetical protein